jgi:hypothetical protein
MGETYNKLSYVLPYIRMGHIEYHNESGRQV